MSTSRQQETILALDPGGTTGYCVGRYDGQILFLKPGQEQFSPAQLMAFLHETDARYLVYERFDYRNKARAGLNLAPAKLIGVIELFIESEGTLFFPQMPGEVKGYWTDEKLNSFGIYVKGIPHGRDAMRHLLHWWQFKFGYKFHKISPFTNYEVV